MTDSYRKRLVILGPPGAGKGTQGKLLAETLGLRHVASGDLVRMHQANGTKLGKRSQEYYAKGLLVPDDVTIQIVLPAALEPPTGFILDGFPRNVYQAQRLDEALAAAHLTIDQALLMTASRPEILERLANRRVCKNCQCIYHTASQPPAEPGQCDVCGSSLYQREDDRPEAIETRFEEYHTQTKPVAKYYMAQGKLARVDGEGSVESVMHRLLEACGVTGAGKTLQPSGLSAKERASGRLQKRTHLA